MQLWPTVRRYGAYLRPHQRGAAVTALLEFVNPLLTIGIFILAKYTVDEALTPQRYDLLPGLLAANLALCILRIWLGYALSLMEAGIVERIARHVRTDLYARLIRLSPGSLEGRSTGDLLSRLSTDVERIEYLIYTGLLAFFADAVRILFFAGFLVYLSWTLSLVAVLALPALVVTSLAFAPRVRRSEIVARRKASAWLDLAEERLNAITLIQSHLAERFESRRFEDRCDSARAAQIRAARLEAQHSGVIELFVSVAGLLVVSVGCYEIARGAATMGTLLAFLGSLTSLYDPARGLAKIHGRMQRAMASAQRVSELFDTRSLVAEAPAAPALKAGGGAIRFDQVRFGYADGPDVVKGVSFSINPGEIVAIVGASGAGKSTIARLLLRLQEARGGAITIDGEDIRAHSLESLRSKVGVVFQEAHLFTGSVAGNIRYATGGVGPIQVQSAAAQARVPVELAGAALDWATPVGPRGGWLSGGQRQRVALARMLVRKPQILVLDEATAAVDSETEELIQTSLQEIAGRHTMLIIGHRLSTIMRASRVIVLEDGYVAEEGSPQELMTRDSRFNRLFEAQMFEKAAA